MSIDFSYEKKLQKRGYRIIIGVDEVGRGPLAGPVSACAVAGLATPKFLGLSDSKKLTPRKREDFFHIFVHSPNIFWAVASVSPKVIDRINIFEATRLAAKRAVLKLEKKIGKTAHLVILDGNTRLRFRREQIPIVRGDEQIASCAIASIIAKVTRDRAMLRHHKKYPEYGFHLHKGYGTKLHFAMLKKYGPCPVHRRSFRPVHEAASWLNRAI